MLTGDKLETAENIGYSCRLIQDEFKKLYILASSNLRSSYNECLMKLKKYKKHDKKVTLLIEGNAISKKDDFSN